jgi:DNA-binding transcriptional ArsR family regulator
MSDWSFITRHAVVLSLIASKPRITALELCETIGITERAIRSIIADLFESNYITKAREGRRIRYGINTDLPIRQDTHQDVEIGNLLETLGWERRSRNN